MIVTFWDLAIFAVTFVIIIWYYGMRKYKHFENTDVKHIKPSVPFLGGAIRVLLWKEHFTDYILKYYNMFPNEKYVGLFDMTKPLIYLRDIEIVKQIGIKDFDHFPNHRNTIDEDSDRLFGKSLVSLQGDKWRDMRGTLSPAFTSSKMKNMFIFIEECAKDMADYYKNKCKDIGTVEIEAKDIFTRYSNDVIANSVFGLKVDSLREQDNDFYRLAKKATNFRGIQITKFIGYALFPKLMKLLNIQFINPEAGSFFHSLLKSTMKTREEKSIIRNDMIHLLMEAKKGSLKHEKEIENSDTGFATVQESTLGKQEVKRKWSDDDLIAQAFIFMFGGFETLSTFIVFFFYEMVRNQHIQKELQKEIDDFLSTHDKITYNDLHNLKYLDKCVSETLRIWPPALATDRVCSKSYTLPPPNENSTKTYEIKPGELVWFPVYAFHHDPKYFPNPEKFDPERFSEENKSASEMHAYLPFGIGPRNCIGSRFALMTGKLIIFHLLAVCDIVSTDKTQMPVILDKLSFNLLAKGGMNLGFKLKTNENNQK